MNSPARVASPPERPVMVFDGECGFCRLWIRRWEQRTGTEVEYVPYQDPEVAARFPELGTSQFSQAVHLIEPDGAVSRGAEAVARCLACAGQRVPLWLYHKVPGLSALAEWAYRMVAEHRRVASAGTRWLWGDSVERPDDRLTRWVFLRSLGLVYLLAFASLGPQLPGLVGSQGILPVGEALERVAQVGEQRGWGATVYWKFPTLSWFNPSDTFLQVLFLAGVGLSLLLIAGMASMPCLALLWLTYLSLVTAGQVFLGFQWDNLLLETGLLAIFLAPAGWWSSPRRDQPPSRAALWLLRWLLFRLMFASGWVKWLSGDPAWRDGTALTYHYETQPLPTPLGYYAHHLPAEFHAVSVWVMYGIEIILPLLIFTPRRLRLVAFWPLLLLQGVIALSGNYGFFNLLTAVLTLLLLDDRALLRILPAFLRRRWISTARPPPPPPWRERLRKPILAGVATVILAVSAWQLVLVFKPALRPPAALAALERGIAPLRSVNSYGLFRIMTRTRPELRIEGSPDGREWRPYIFPHKPGPLDRSPSWVAPHMPRLDWQMWFAALGHYRQHPWIVGLCLRLGEGSQAVLDLLESNPFPDEPPRYLRIRGYDYQFTTPSEKKRTGHWWKRTRTGIYLGPLQIPPPTLEDRSPDEAELKVSPPSERIREGG